jgi:hypothetical protein
VHEWIKKRDAADDLQAIVDDAEFERWASAIEGMSKTEAKYSLKQLVDEGYITLVHMATELSYEPFVYFVPQSLTEKGLLAIGEMPDPQERLALILEAAIQAVEKDDSLDKDEKKKRIDWFEEAKIAVRTLGIEGAKAVLRGDIPPM